MKLSEKQIIKIAEKIFESYLNLSTGKKPGIFSGSVFNSIEGHPKKKEMLDQCKEYFSVFNGKISEIHEWERLAKFRLKLIELYFNTD